VEFSALVPVFPRDPSPEKGKKPRRAAGLLPFDFTFIEKM
jgi:hypothetical protein